MLFNEKHTYCAINLNELLVTLDMREYGGWGKLYTMPYTSAKHEFHIRNKIVSHMLYMGNKIVSHGLHMDVK